MIVLSSHEKEIIKMIKKDVKLSVDDWYVNLCPLFTSIFEYKFTDGRGKLVMFNHLFMLYMKIYTGDQGMEVNLLTILHTSFNPTIDTDQDDPVDRCIHKICELIQSNRVSGRYSLN